MKINKIRPILHFSTKLEIKMTCLVFVFCYLLSLRRQSHLEAVLLTFKILTASKWLQRRRNSIKITRHKHKASHFYFQFCRKMEVRTYFVYFHTFPQKFKVQRTPTEFRLPVIYFDLFPRSLLFHFASLMASYGCLLYYRLSFAWNFGWMFREQQGIPQMLLGFCL